MSLTPETGDDRSGPVDTDITQALTDHARPLDSVSPEDTGDDLGPIGDAASEVTVFGMGEASHGTREFFQAKHRIFRYLATEHDYRLFGMEIDFAAGLAINDYVTGGDKSAFEVLTQNGVHTVYKTASVLELIEWIREFNSGREEADKIRVHGFDMQDSTAAARKLEQYFQRVAPDVLEDVADEIEEISNTPTQAILDDEERLSTRLNARETVVERLGNALESNKQTYIERTAPEQYELARRLVWQLEQGRKQFEAVLSESEGMENVTIRDRAMADQIQWLLEYESVDQIAIWGHNGHLIRSGYPDSDVSPEARDQVPSTGAHLADNDEISYFALGLSLGGGTVRSAYVLEQEFGGFRAYDIADPPPDSLPGVFSGINEPLFFLNTSQLPPASPLWEWFDSNPVDYSIEGRYEETPVSQVAVDPKAEFDGLLFIRNTTASTMLFDREWILSRPSTALAHPLNTIGANLVTTVKRLRSKIRRSVLK